MPIDAWLPEYDFSEHHETRVAAPRERVWASLLALRETETRRIPNGARHRLCYAA